jgi:uncharacterized protein (TIGR02996 family)
MNEHEAFIRAILADPADDTPRLIFADWLTERGSPFGDYLASAMKMDRHSDCPVLMKDRAAGRPRPMRCGLCDYCTARQRCESCGYPWVSAAIPADVPYSYILDPGLDLYLPPSHGSLHFVIRRGFIESVALPCADFLRHAEALFRAQPITRVTLSDRDAGGAYHDGAGIAFVRRQPSDTRDSPDTLPDVLFDRLVSPESANFVSLHVGDSVGWIELKYFPDAADARDALSDSCVAHGRELAGLPPLPAPSPEARRRADA